MCDCPDLPFKRMELQDKNAELWLAGPARDSAILERLWAMLSAAEKERADRYSRLQDRMLFVMTRSVLRALLAKATGAAAGEIAFAEGASGKPFLSGGREPHFNVSHSGEFALIGLSKRCPIGVDIEKIHSTGDELNAARIYFSDAENRLLQNLGNDARAAAFYTIWTCKEAALKACGAGITEHLKHVSIAFSAHGVTVDMGRDRFAQAIGSVYAEPVAVPEGYAACCALARMKQQKPRRGCLPDWRGSVPGT